MLTFNNTWCNTTLIHLKTLTSPLKSQSPNSSSPSQTFSLHFSTDSTSFAVSYLIHNFGFSQKFASKLCSSYDVRFTTAQNPDSVLNFFRDHGFSDSQLRHTIAKAPWLLSCNPDKRVLPKFQFFLSKGTSKSDIVNLVGKNPKILKVSLNNQIIQAYELIYRILQSHEDTIACLIHNPGIFSSNITLLLENGVANSNIRILLRYQSGLLLNTRDMLNVVDELRDLGFNPSKTTFGVALIAKLSVTKTLWKQKVDTFKKWGWSDEDVLEAFKKQPHCMITSIDKINLVMSFLVNQLGWDGRVIAKIPNILLLSLEKRIIPRAAVVQFLLNNGLRSKNASLIYPFLVPEKLFLDRFIKRFENEASYLLKLYEEKLNLAYTTNKNCM